MSQYFKSFFNIFIISYLCMIFLVEADIDQKVTDSLQHFENECGRLSEKEELVAKIIGGEEAKYREGPWMAFVGHFYSGKLDNCDGSLIGPRHVLTAAHCFDGYTNEAVEAGLYRVFMGHENLLFMFNYHIYTGGCASDNKYKYTVTGVHRHPQYKEVEEDKNAAYDMAILVLDRDVIVSATTPVKPICLPNADFNTDIDNKMVDILGWGDKDRTKVDVRPKVSSILRKAKAKIWSNTECKIIRKFIVEAKNRICVGDKNQNFGNGDSGSPVAIPIDNRYIQVGIHILGTGAKEVELLPGLSEKVTLHIDWIKTTVKDTLRTSYEREEEVYI